MSVQVAPGRVKLRSCGNAFPGEHISNDVLLEHLEELCDRKTARQARIIARRLGIEGRYVSRRLDSALSVPQETAPVLSARAIRQALSSCPADTELGYLISHTASPHTLLPSSAAWIAEELALQAPYMELRQACTGFASALQIAVPMLHHNPQMQPVCIVGTEVGSVFFDIDNDFIDTPQLINYVQMGDAAAAVVLDRDDGSDEQIISHCFSGHMGLNRAPGFELCGGGSAQPVCEQKLPYFLHRADSVREAGPQLFLKGIEAVMDQGFSLNEFDYILPHQANGHIDALLSEYLQLPPERIVNDARRWGNLGSAAIWASLNGLILSGKLKRGQRVLVLGAEATKYMYGGFIYQH